MLEVVAAAMATAGAVYSIVHGHGRGYSRVILEGKKLKLSEGSTKFVILFLPWFFSLSVMLRLRRHIDTKHETVTADGTTWPLF